MAYSIRKAGVVGAGTMGSGIAALLAGVGVPVVLLDLPAPDTTPDAPPEARNAPALGGIARLQSARPPALFAPDDAALISTGNTEDDLHLLADADWVIEVVVEKLDVKRALFRRLTDVVRPDAILSTNTSGLPITQIADGMGQAFARRFMGTHFFNPPRYLRLVELIPHPHTDPDAVAFMRQFISGRLGKGVVPAKDAPNFIGNRFLSMLLAQTVNYALDNNYTVAEVDALTGTLIGRPKTATFRLSDLIGNDVIVDIARNLHPALPDDPDRDMLTHPGTTALYDALLEQGALGNKSSAGFYKMVRSDDGGKAFWTLNLRTHTYEPAADVTFESVSAHRKVRDTGERVRLLLRENDRAARFLLHHIAFYLTYASKRVPEVTDTLVSVDNAQTWGFAHDLGPFELWDALGVAASVAMFADAGYPPAAWVNAMLSSGHKTFYQRDEHGIAVGFYSPQAGTYLPLARSPHEVHLGALRAGGAVVQRNDGADLIDMGDGVALLAMTTANAVIDHAFVQAGLQAAAALAQGQFRALVIGNDGARFCIGANLAHMLAAVQGGNLDDLEQLVQGIQDLTLALRDAPAPVVTAPFDMALGGGAELLMAGDATVAHMELYVGLVEVGVGLIPAGSGIKELLRRAVNPVMRVPDTAPLPHLRALFDHIMSRQTSGSAKAARSLHYLRPHDRIVMNRAHLLTEAKRTALYLAHHYAPPQPERIYWAGEPAHAALLAEIASRQESGQYSAHDAHIARTLAGVLTGGDAEPGWVHEQTVLDAELAAFVALAQTENTQARIAHMLRTNKPLRN